VYRARLATAGPAPTIPELETTPSLALPDKPSIAVLPFQNISGDPDQEYFADGMVEEIITALSKLRWFFVIARNSSFTYKGRAIDVKQVGRELGVRYVLEGSVRKGGNRLRITAQLVDATNGNHLWAERYDRDLNDIFAVQDEITERVVAAIEPELYAAENIRSRRKPPESLDAWECVIRALTCIGLGTREANSEAEALCRRAIAIFPGYGQAHSLLAWSILRRSIWLGDFKGIVPEVSAETAEALALDDRDPWAYVAQGMLSNRLRRFDDGVRAWRKALELNPNFALAHAVLSLALSQKSEFDEAIQSAQRAMRLSPSDRLVGTYATFGVAMAHFAAARYSEAIMATRNMIERVPGDIRGRFLLAAALAMHGDSHEAKEACEALLRVQPGFSVTWAMENLPWTGGIGERLREGLRKAGVPEK
jgi:TolB-like protein